MDTPHMLSDLPVSINLKQYCNPYCKKAAITNRVAQNINGKSYGTRISLLIYLIHKAYYCDLMGIKSEPFPCKDIDLRKKYRTEIETAVDNLISELLLSLHDFEVCSQVKVTKAKNLHAAMLSIVFDDYDSDMAAELFKNERDLLIVSGRKGIFPTFTLPDYYVNLLKKTSELPNEASQSVVTAELRNIAESLSNELAKVPKSHWAHFDNTVSQKTGFTQRMQELLILNAVKKFRPNMLEIYLNNPDRK
jgi:hypothetical protein